MANYHSDIWIMNGVKRHYDEAVRLYGADRIVCVVGQGSINYGLDYEGSDIDTKCILVPSLEDIVMNRKPVSTTHVLDNDEHLDAKDIRLYFQTFRKQNMNFIEILFSKYKIINPFFADLWQILVDANEEIARYDPYRAIKTMSGIGQEKYHALEHRYPSKVELIDKYGADPKQLHHLVRVRWFLQDYLAGKPYAECLRPDEIGAEFLKSLKTIPPVLSLDEMREIANEEIDIIKSTVDRYTAEDFKVSKAVDFLLDTIQREIMIRAIKQEIKGSEKNV